MGCSASLILNPCSELGGGRQRHPQVLWAPTALPQGLRGCGDSTVPHTQPPPALLLPTISKSQRRGGKKFGSVGEEHITPIKPMHQGTGIHAFPEIWFPISVLLS